MGSKSARPAPSRATAAVATVAIAASFLHVFCSNLADEDLWNHVTWGRTMLADHAVVRVDRWSYTAVGAPFFDHEWLADVLFAALFDGVGSVGLVLLKLALGLLAVLAVLDAARTLGRTSGLAGGLHPGTVAAALVLALAVVGPGASFRPQLFTIAFLALEWALLERAHAHLAAGRSPGRALAAVPLLVLAWANLHGGFLVGVGLAGVFAACVVGGAPRSRGALLAVLAALATAAAPLVNPYGVSLYDYLLGTLGLHDRITEWMPVVPWDGSHLRFKAMVVATAAVAIPWWWSRRRVPGGVLDWRLAFVGVAAVAAFRHQRHTVLFAIAAAPVLAVAAETARAGAVARVAALRPRRPVAAAVAAGVLAVAGIQLAAVGGRFAADGAGIRVPPDEFPAAAVGFLRAGATRGNVLVPFEWGAYALYHLGDGARVFIDGRFEAVYPSHVIDDWFRFADARPGWERALDAYPTDVVVLERNAEVREQLAAREDFVQVYDDPVALVFLRRTPANVERLERLARLAPRVGSLAGGAMFP